MNYRELNSFLGDCPAKKNRKMLEHFPIDTKFNPFNPLNQLNITKV